LLLQLQLLLSWAVKKDAPNFAQLEKAFALMITMMFNVLKLLPRMLTYFVQLKEVIAVLLIFS
jgi:hypothetical protein